MLSSQQGIADGGSLTSIHSMRAVPTLQCDSGINPEQYGSPTRAHWPCSHKWLAEPVIVTQ
jgi:hypothetical protein